MWRQAKKSGVDAVIMKVITVIAVVYLPATFVAVRDRGVSLSEQPAANENADLL